MKHETLNLRVGRGVRAPLWAIRVDNAVQIPWIKNINDVEQLISIFNFIVVN